MPYRLPRFGVARQVTDDGFGLIKLAQLRGNLLKRWCPKKYAASNVPVIDIEKTDGKYLEVINISFKNIGFYVSCRVSGGASGSYSPQYQRCTVFPLDAHPIEKHHPVV